MSKEQKGRVGPTERLSPSKVEQFYPIQITERDIQLLDFIERCGGATTEQSKKGFFPGNWTTCTKRLQKLFQNSLLWRFFIDPRSLGLEDGQETLWHCLDAEGAKLLAQRRGVPVETIWQPSDKKISQETLKHLLPTVDILISFQLAAAKKGYTIKDLQTDFTWRKKPMEQRLKVDYVATYGNQDSYERGEIIPDASYTLVTPQREFELMVEYHAGTEVLQHSTRPRAGVRDSSVVNKIRRYIALLHKEKRTEPSVYEKITGKDQRGIRVLFVTKGNETQGLFELIQEAGGKNSYWIAPISLVKREDLVLDAPIWAKCGDATPIYTPLLGRSALQQVRDCLRGYGVEPGEIEARVSRITDMAREELANGWNERGRGMSLDVAVALRVDELAEATLKDLRRSGKI